MRILFSLLPLAVSGAAFATPPQAVPKVSPETNATLTKDLAAGEATGSAAADGVADMSAADPALTSLMDKIEHGVALPKGAAALTAYARLYAWADQPRGKVTAIYLRRATPGRKWIGFDDLPAIQGGGCDVVELVWDVASGRTEEIGCNTVS